MESIHTTRGAFYRGFLPLLSRPTNFYLFSLSHSLALFSSLFFFSTPPLNLGFGSLSPSNPSLPPRISSPPWLKHLHLLSSSQSRSLISPWIKIPSSQPNQASSPSDRLSSPRIEASSLFLLFSSCSIFFLSILNFLLFSCNGFSIFLLYDWS